MSPCSDASYLVQKKTKAHQTASEQERCAEGDPAVVLSPPVAPSFCRRRTCTPACTLSSVTRLQERESSIVAATKYMYKYCGGDRLTARRRQALLFYFTLRTASLMMQPQDEIEVHHRRHLHEACLFSCLHSDAALRWKPHQRNHLLKHLQPRWLPAALQSKAGCA